MKISLPKKITVAVFSLFVSFQTTKLEAKSNAPEAAPISQNLEQKPRVHQTLSTFADISIARGQKTHHFDAALILQFPNKLRLEVLDDLGQRQMLLIASGQQVFWRDETSGKQKLIPQDPKSLKKALKIPISVEEFVALLLQRLPQTPEHFEVEWQDETQSLLKNYRLFRNVKKKKWIYEFKTETISPELRRVVWDFKKPKFKVEARLQAEDSRIIDPAKFEIIE